MRKGILQKIGLPHHEFWPLWLLGLLTVPMWLWYAIRLRNISFFTTINPSIKNGGFCGESKIAINQLIPNLYLPATVNIYLPTNVQTITKLMLENGLQFPIITKPEFGGRGRKVAVIETTIDLEKYCNSVGENFMVQEKLNTPMELGVFFIKLPNAEKIIIPSVTIKEMMTVIGDGNSTVETLMLQNPRYAKQVNRLLNNNPTIMATIPSKDEHNIIEPIGNHCRGTIFRDANHLINEKLIDVFTEICMQIQGINYGRFDVKVTNLQDLYAGRNISILELNGINADPAHIFDPESRLSDALKTQAMLAKWGFIIAKNNMRQGVQPVSLFNLYKIVKKFLGL